ncbi:MAG TPA: response regulator [Thermoanaerobaculia bacterium]|jgi:DNA-binding response OmpR family regulator/DNA-directed RNA polymerase subunit RPC12/RpoP
MDLTCRKCGSTFRAAIATPLTSPVRVACPRCEYQMVLKPRASGTYAAAAQTEAPQPAAAPAPAPPALPRRRVAAIADEPRPFRSFLGEHLRRLGFEVAFFETGDPTLDFVRRTRAELVIVNVYLKGKLGVEVAEEIKADASLANTRVILIGALFRANRFRANPTNLYGADEYIEEQIPEKEFRQIIRKLFPEIGGTAETPVEPREYDEARRLARLILSDIIIYNQGRVEDGIRNNNFFEVLREEIEEGRQYYESRVPMRVRRDTEIFTETLQQFVQMKREELERLKTGTQ